MIARIILCLALASASARAGAQKPGGELKVVEVLFEDYNGGLDPRWEMKAGEEVLLSFRVEGFKRLPVERKDGLREDRVHLHYQIELRDPLGVLVTPEGQGDVETTLGPQDDKWRPKIDWSARVPSSAPTGDYGLLIRVNDQLATQDSTKNVSFRVVGEPVPSGDNLQVVQLGYSNSEAGPWSRERYFSPAEPIWVRYKIVGCRVSQEGVWVEQDWTVMDEDGKVIVSQENAAVEKEKSFYPPRFLSTIFDLDLKGPKPGKYTLRVELRDRVGDQAVAFESNFYLRP